jgi:hypothetical protein
MQTPASLQSRFSVRSTPFPFRGSVLGSITLGARGRTLSRTFVQIGSTPFFPGHMSPNWTTATPARPDTHSPSTSAGRSCSTFCICNFSNTARPCFLLSQRKPDFASPSALLHTNQFLQQPLCKVINELAYGSFGLMQADCLSFLHLRLLFCALCPPRLQVAGGAFR